LFGVHCNKCVVIVQFGELYSSSQFVCHFKKLLHAY
jgi:hypothetical protein